MELHINLINGTPNYTVTFSPSVSGSPFTFDSKGIKSFFDLPEDNYIITGVDVNGCEYILNHYLPTTTTTTLAPTTTTTTLAPTTTTTTLIPTTTTTTLAPTTTTTTLTPTTTTTTLAPTTTTTTTIEPALIIGGGNGSARQYSPDETNWLPSTLSTISGPIFYLFDKWFGFHNSMSNAYATSTNGINWTYFTAPIDSYQGTYDACWTGKNIVIAGQGNTLCDIAVSTDGITWTNKLKLASGMAQALVCYYNYVICGGSTIDLYSIDDGESWTSFSLSNVTVMYDACYNDNIWVIVGRGTSHTISTTTGLPHLGTTGRGKTIFTVGGESVAWNGVMFVAVGSGGNHVAYSYDGIIWTGLGLFTNISIMYDVKWDGDTWWICGSVSTTSKGIFKSTDGINWTGVGINAGSGYNVYRIGVKEQQYLYPPMISGSTVTTTTTTITPPTSPELIFEWTVPSANVTLPLRSGYAYNMTVDWGDGSPLSTVTYNSDPNATHAYTGGTYQVKISGTCQALNVNNNATTRGYFKKVIQWGNVGYTSMTSAFYGCNNLNTLPTEGIPFGVDNFLWTFRGCTSLTSIPVDIFSKNRFSTSFGHVFRGCTSLISIPNDLFKYNIVANSFENCFDGCTSLTSIPSDLFRYNTNITSLSYCFGNCTNSSLTIPTDIFRYNTNVTSFSYAFSACRFSAITTDVFRYNTNVTGMSGVFYNCINLTSIPIDLFRYNTNVTSFASIFRNCSSLVTVPDLFRYNTTTPDFSAVLMSCSKLETLPSDFFRYNTGATNFSFSFSGCIKLQLHRTIYSAIGEESTRFANKTINFTQAFNRTSFTGTTQGEAPELWNYTFSAVTSTSCFGGVGNSLTSLSNYCDIPLDWGGTCATTTTTTESPTTTTTTESPTTTTTTTPEPTTTTTTTALPPTTTTTTTLIYEEVLTFNTNATTFNPNTQTDIYNVNAVKWDISGSTFFGYNPNISLSGNTIPVKIYVANGFNLRYLRTNNVNIVGDLNLNNIKLNKLDTLDISNNSVSNIIFYDNIDQLSEINIYNCDNLTYLDLSSFQDCSTNGGSISIGLCNLLTGVTLCNTFSNYVSILLIFNNNILTYVDGSNIHKWSTNSTEFRTDYNPLLTTILLDDNPLQKLNAEYISTEGTTNIKTIGSVENVINLSFINKVGTYTNFYIEGKFNSVILPTIISGNFYSLYISSPNLSGNIDLSVLKTFDGDGNILIANNSGLTSINASGLTINEITTFTVNHTTLTDLNIDGSNFYSININNCPITNFSYNGCEFFRGNYSEFLWANGGLTDTQVDQLFINIDNQSFTSGLTSCGLNLNNNGGVTSNSLTARNNLIAKGITVSY